MSCPHVNNLYGDVAECPYQRHSEGLLFLVCLPISKSRAATAQGAEHSSILVPSDHVIINKCQFSHVDGSARCAHFHIGRCCLQGYNCTFAHVIEDLCVTCQSIRELPLTKVSHSSYVLEQRRLHEDQKIIPDARFHYDPYNAVNVLVFVKKKKRPHGTSGRNPSQTRATHRGDDGCSQYGE